MANTKEIQHLVERLVAQGFRVEPVKSGPSHFVVYPPNKQHPPVHIAGTGDWRGYLNDITRLKRAGFSPSE